MLRITDDLIIPDDELELRFARSGGRGGQHVNRTETKVELRFDLAGTTRLSEGVKRRIAERFPSQVTADGQLRVTSEATRSQADNRADAEERMAALIRGCLRAPRRRRRTTVPRSQKRKRLDEKRKRGEVKRSRRSPDGEG